MPTQRREEKRERDRERERETESTHTGEKDPRAFGSSFYTFFLLPLGLPYVSWASQECCLFHLRSSLASSDLPLFCFCGLFPCLLSTAILDSFFLF